MEQTHMKLNLWMLLFRMSNLFAKWSIL